MQLDKNKYDSNSKKNSFFSDFQNFQINGIISIDSRY